MTVPVNPVYALQMVFLIFFVDFMLFVVYSCLYLIVRYYIKLILDHVEQKLTEENHTDGEQYLERDLAVDV